LVRERDDRILAKVLTRTSGVDEIQFMPHDRRDRDG
jgi:hypothetical protein